MKVASMACRSANGFSIMRSSALLTATAAATLFAFGVAAQTLTDPNPPPKWVREPAAKSRPAMQQKSCKAFGAGFVNVPGTDACVKIGGWVGVEGSAGR
jgi:hypothetical protein